MCRVRIAGVWFRMTEKVAFYFSVWMYLPGIPTFDNDNAIRR